MAFGTYTNTHTDKYSAGARTLALAHTLVLALALVGCGAAGANNGRSAGHGQRPPANAEVPEADAGSASPTMPVTPRVHVTLVYWDDDTGSYPRTDFVQANAYIADLLDASLRPNQDGVTAYISPITSASFDEAHSYILTVPTMPQAPPAPALQPMPAPTGNPFADVQARAKVTQANDQAMRAYQSHLTEYTAQLALARQQVTRETDALRHFTPPVDSRATSIWGALARAEGWFAGETGSKWLVLASDMLNNTDADEVAHLSLAGVHVRVLFFVCQHPAGCDAVTAYWGQVFQHAGAADWAFYDPARSQTLPPLF